jgi:hypothetical protein
MRDQFLGASPDQTAYVDVEFALRPRSDAQAKCPIRALQSHFPLPD